MSDQVKHMFANIGKELAELTHFVEEEDKDNYFDPFGSMEDESMDEDEYEMKDNRSLALVVKRMPNEAEYEPDSKKIKKN